VLDSAHALIPSILAAFTLPADHRRIAFVTPLIHGGSLAGLLDWRSRLADTPKHAHDSKFHLPRLHARTHERDQGVKILPRGVLSEEEIKAVVRQVLEGLRYLHERGYIHVSALLPHSFPHAPFPTTWLSARELTLQRDIKAGNLLVEKDGTIMLADFGVVGDMNGPLTPTERGRPGAEDMRFVPPAPVTATGQEGKVEQVGGLGRRKSFVGTVRWSDILYHLAMLSHSRIGWRPRWSLDRNTMPRRIYGAWE
jgi:serine/threonine protein kinase